MKKVFFILWVFGFVLTARLFSLDMELIGGLGNFAFDRNQSQALSAGTAGAFDPHLFPLALVRVSGEREGLFWNLGFERDPLTRNRLFGNLKAELSYFFIEAGPFIGVFNAPREPLELGISAALGVTVPGVFFARAEGSSGLGAVTDMAGSCSQSSGRLSAGFWVPYVICSLNTEYRNFAVREDSTLLIEDALARYFFSADVFTKNVPYTIKVDLGYQNLSRSYIVRKVNGASQIENAAETDEIKSIFVGVEGTYTFNSSLKFLLGGEMPVYAWCVRPMRDPPKGTALFKARAGVVWTLE